jgi:hypothetical protein
MRCVICDKALSDTEVVFNKDLNDYEPCYTCLEIAMDAAFSQGHHRPDDEIDDEFGDGIVEILDTDVGVSDLQGDSRSWGDAGDIPVRDDYD